MSNSITNSTDTRNIYEDIPDVYHEEIKLTNPIAILAATQQAVEIANGIANFAQKIKSLFGAPSDTGLLTEIKEEIEVIQIKLDSLIARQEFIIEKLRKLRFEIREEVLNGEVQRIHTSVRSWAFNFKLLTSKLGQNLNDPNSKKVITRIKELLDGPASVALFEPTFWGPACVISTSTAYCMWYKMAALTNQTDKYILVGLEQFKAAFLEAEINAKEISSAFEEEMQQIKVYIQSKMNSNRTLVSRSVDPRRSDNGHESCTWTQTTEVYLEITGDINSGFEGRRVTQIKHSNKHCRRNRLSERDPRKRVSEDNNRIYGEAQETIVNMLTPGNNGLIHKANFDHRGIVSDLNRKRSEFFALKAKAQTVQNLTQHLEKLISSTQNIMAVHS